MGAMTRPSASIVDATGNATPPPGAKDRASRLAQGLRGSEILKIAAEIRALQKQGRPICNLTVGDFDPKHFPIPAGLTEAIVQAYRRGETNYPPSDGMPQLREAVQRLYERELSLRYPLASFLIASGARPVIYAAYRATVDPGDRILYPVPSWNNNHYAHLVDAESVVVPCTAATRFLPTRAQLEPHLPGARVLCLNSPNNPAGTAIDPAALRELCEAIVAENAARARRDERPLFLFYDQIYRALCLGDTVHATPTGVLPEMAKYTIYVDGISKSLAATGVRVGWAVGPTDVIARMSAIVGHVGAWAPRPEQLATAEFLDSTDAMHDYLGGFREAIGARLALLHDGLGAMAKRGLPVESLPPMGAIYLPARIAPFGKKTPDGATLTSNEDIRRYVLGAAGVGIVPFQAFGCSGEDGWFRMSIGAVGPADIDAALIRLEKALRALG